MKFTIFGRIPSKKNSRTIVMRGKYPLSIPSKNYNEWHIEQSWVLKKYVPAKPIDCCTVVITLFKPDRRRTDLINKGESIQDTLVDIGMLRDDDDTCITSLHMVSGGVDKENPRAEVEIIELENKEENL